MASDASRQKDTRSRPRPASEVILSIARFLAYAVTGCTLRVGARLGNASFLA